MARVRLPVVAEALDPSQVLRDKFPANGATIKFYEPGTAAVSGTTTTGTPLSTSLYSGPSGGSPISTSQTADATGMVVVWAERPTAVGQELTCDIGVEYTAPTGAVAAVRARERFETDPDDLVWVDDLPIFNASRPNLIGGTWYAPVVESTTNGDATTNRTRLGLLFGAVGARGGGVIRLPRNATSQFWWFDAGVVLDTGAAAPSTVHLVGDGPRITRIKFTGSSGTFLSLQPTTAHDLVRPYFMNFSVHHDADCTSGTDFLLNTDCADARFVDVEWWPDFDGFGAWTCITAKNNTHLTHCRVSSRTTGTPRTFVQAHTTGAYELMVNGRTRITTALAVLADPPGVPNYVGGGTNIQLQMDGDMDLVSITDRSILSGGDESISHRGTGTIFQLRIQGCQLDVANHHVVSAPTAGGLRTLVVEDSWVHADVSAVVVQPTGAAISTRVTLKNLETNGAYQYFAYLDGVTHARVDGCQIQMYTRPSTSYTQPTDAIAVYINGTGTTAEVVNNYILVDPTLAPAARAAIEIGSAVAHIRVTPNTINVPLTVRPILFHGARTQAMKLWPNAIYSTDNTAADPERSGLIADVLTAHPTTNVLWIPTWGVGLTETTAESAAGRTITHNANLTTLLRQHPLGNDRCGVAYVTNQYSVIADAAALSYGTSGLTIAVLARVADLASDQSLVSKADTGAEEYWLYVDAAGKLVWYVVDQTAGVFLKLTSTNDVADSGDPTSFTRPHLWVATLAAGAGPMTTADMAIYEDGTLMGNTPTNNGVFTQLRDTAANLEFGAHNNHTSAFLSGRIYYEQQMPGALTAVQVHALTHRLNKYFGLGL